MQQGPLYDVNYRDQNNSLLFQHTAKQNPIWYDKFTIHFQ